MILKGFMIIFLYLTIGNFITEFFSIPIAGSILGMLLLTASFMLKVVSVDSVKQASNILIDNMTLLYIPSSVGIILYFDLISSNILPIVFSSFITTFFVLAFTGLIQQKLEKSDEEILKEDLQILEKDIKNLNEDLTNSSNSDEIKKDFEKMRDDSQIYQEDLSIMQKDLQQFSDNEGEEK